MDTIRVDLLADVPQFTEIAMTWIFNEWGAPGGRTLADVIKNASRYSNKDRLPIMFIASRDGHPIGCVALRDNDMIGWKHLTPWLASMYVERTCRGHGVASLLAGFLEDAACNLGHRQVFLYTPDAASLYEKLGWQVIETPVYLGQPVSIMSKHLGS